MKTDYDPNIKFEINSLNGVLSNLLNQLQIYKKKQNQVEIDSLLENSPYFKKYMVKHYKDRVELPMVQQSIKFVEKSSDLIREEISNMKVLDEKDKDFYNKKTQFHKQQERIESYYMNSKNLV